MHQNEALLRREYEAREARDDRALAELITEDVVWHVPGRNAIAGEYRGIDQVMDYIRRRQELAEGTFEIAVHDVLANDRHGFGCVAKPFKRTQIRRARRAMLRDCGSISSSSFTDLKGTVTISGVGFWDEDHGETGVAPNAIELHPVLSFAGSCSHR